MNAKQDRIAKDFISAIQTPKVKTEPYDTEAEVTRVEGETAWVHIAGGIDETPVKKTINCEKGDKVQIRVGGGDAWIVGNATAPPTDDTTALEAKVKSLEAEFSAQKAKALAEEASQRVTQEIQTFSQAILDINGDIIDLQQQIDGNITTWFYQYAPTTSNAPANTWTTTEEKNNHLGDLFYDTSTGYAYRWMVENNVYSWGRITDEDVTEALALASQAQDTADSKRRVFITQPTPPYDIGDLWCVGASGDILTCTTAKTENQSYSSSDWSKLNKYTDDTSLNTFLSNTYASDKTNLQNQIDGKAETWYQINDPSSAWTTTALKQQHEGDLWYYTGSTTSNYKQNATYRWNGTAWQQENVPVEVFDKIDGKAQIFTSQPTPPYSVGDLWFNSTTSDIMTCINSRSTGSYVASDWQKRNKYTDDTVANQAKTIADNTNQYFWFTSTGTDTGAHITEVPQDEFTDSTSPNYQSGGNLLARSNGIAVRNGLTELATFGATEANIGGSTGRHTVLDTGGLKVFNGTTLIGQIGYGSGNDESGTSTKPYFVLGERKTTATAYSSSNTYDIGDVCKYDNTVYVCISAIDTPEAWDSSHWQLYVGNYSVVNGYSNIASGFASHAEGKETQAIEKGSHSEGWAQSTYKILATGTGSHAEGYGAYKNVLASGEGSHAEGSGTTASGFASHAEGNQTEAIGSNSHAEGQITIATGVASHAEGYQVLASSHHQHAQGQWNVEDTNSTYADIVGWGLSSSERKNIFALSTGGDGRYKGDVYVQCNDDSTGGKKLVVADSSVGDPYTYSSSTAYIGLAGTNENLGSSLNGTYALRALATAPSLYKSGTGEVWKGYTNLNKPTPSDIGASPAPSFSSVSAEKGKCTIGDLQLVWGYATGTAGSTASTSGGLSTYANTLDVTFGVTFKYAPTVMADWTANYANQVSIAVTSISTTGCTLQGRITTTTARGMRWLAIGQKA